MSGVSGFPPILSRDRAKAKHVLSDAAGGVEGAGLERTYPFMISSTRPLVTE